MDPEIQVDWTRWFIWLYHNHIFVFICEISVKQQPPGRDVTKVSRQKLDFHGVDFCVKNVASSACICNFKKFFWGYTPGPPLIKEAEGRGSENTSTCPERKTSLCYILPVSLLAQNSGDACVWIGLYISLYRSTIWPIYVAYMYNVSSVYAVETWTANKYARQTKFPSHYIRSRCKG